MRSRRLRAELIALNACRASNLGVILHGSVHHHKVRQECPQVRNCPLHDPLRRDRPTEDPSVDVNTEAEVGKQACSSLLRPPGEAFRHIIDAAVDKQASGGEHVREQESSLKEQRVFFWVVPSAVCVGGLTRSLCCWCLR